MGGAVYRARAEVRARVGSWVALGVLVGVFVGVAGAAMAGARRTESAYPRFLKTQRAVDVLMDVRSAGTGQPVSVEQVRSLPAVADAAPVAALFNAQIVTPSGGMLSFPDVFIIWAPDGRFGRELNISKVIEGRRPAESAIDEVLLGYNVARRAGVKVGDQLNVRFAELDPQMGAPTGKILAQQKVTVTGLGVMPGEVSVLAGGSLPSMHVTEAFGEKYRPVAQADVAYGVRLRAGASGITAASEQVQQRGWHGQAFFEQKTQTGSVRRSSRFNAAALWAIAALTLLATIAIAGQAIARQVNLEAADFPVLRSLGMARADLLGSGMATVAVVSLVGLVVSAAIIVASSLFTPVGIARVAEPTPGLAVDLLSIVASAGVVLLVVGGATLLVRMRESGGAVLSRRASLLNGRPSRFAGLLSRAGAPVTAVAGTRMALEQGKGRNAVPVRAASGVVALGIIGVAAALTFASGMDRLIETRALSGWTFDLVVAGPPDQVERYTGDLRRQGVVDDATVGRVSSFWIEGKSELSAGLVFPAGRIGPAIAEGRAPSAPDEVAAGRDTMARFDLDIGDEIDLSVILDGQETQSNTPEPSGRPRRSTPRPFTIVGRCVAPSIGFNLGSAGECIALTTDGFATIPDGQQDTDIATFVRLTQGRDVGDAIALASARYPALYVAGSDRATDAVGGVRAVRSYPWLFAALLGVMALGAMTHALLASIRRRGRDLAILRTLGFVGRQVRATVMWQATFVVLVAAAVGLPLGVIAGRIGWLAFADRLGVVPVAVVPAMALAAIVPAALLAANLAAAVPAGARRMGSPAQPCAPSSPRHGRRTFRAGFGGLRVEPVGMKTSRNLLILILAALPMAGSALVPAQATVANPVYVALGDSYTSAPLISRPMGTYPSYTDPYDCGKSDENYPHRLARHLGVENTSGFVDVSCGSARTKHMQQDQTGLPFGSTNRRQFAALEDFASDPNRITLVSVGIGGNDLGFGELQDYCIQPPEQAGGTPCRTHYENVNGVGDPNIEGDIIEHRLGILQGTLGAVVDGIRTRAPNAEILVYGYPALLPEYTDGCYPYIPILPTDAAYLREAEKKLNHTIRAVARAKGAHYVDWYSPSIGHDMCQPPGIAWVNGVVLAPPSYPVHPNLLGTWGAGNAGIGVLDSIDFNFATGRGLG